MKADRDASPNGLTLAALGAALLLALCGPSIAQEEPQAESPEGLSNPSFETADLEGRPQGWAFVTRPEDKQTLTLGATDPSAGERAALLDCSDGSNEFTNLMQAIDATPYQGERVRFRAAVRTEDVADSARVQLWFRVDTTAGMGAFDNMQDRPITTTEWKDFDIVLDVADDATRLNVGMFVIGNAKAWIDDVRFEIVESDVVATSTELPGSFSAALKATAEAPTQPLWTPWLWLALLTCVLFVLSQLGGVAVEDEAAGALGVATVTRFAFRFSLVYWLLYSLPRPFHAITPPFLQPILTGYSNGFEAVTRWTGSKILGIEGEMFSPNGSGDTTYAYVTLFVCFVGALLAAMVWSLVDRKRTDLRISKDLLRSYLRYVLAATMIGYGLAKVGFVRNQFPVPGDFQLSRTYGDSSPMGLLWTFMGASRAYTIFGGLGELIGGVLLLWRRTTTLGALVIVAVMVNVVMLNFSYDVPVKQYSVHLVVMALFLLLPEAKRLANVLLFNRPTADRDLGPAFVHSSSPARLRWGRWILKAALILTIAVIPITQHSWREWQHARQQDPAAEDQAKGDEDEEPLLMRRGFRWISEAPYNR